MNYTIMKKIITLFVSFCLLSPAIAVSADDVVSKPLNLTLSKEQLKEALRPQPKKEFSQEKSQIFFIKVTHNSVMTDDWAKKMCASSAEVLSSTYGSQTQSHCFKTDSDNATSRSLFNQKKFEINPDFLFEINRGLDGFIKIKLTNLRQTDPSYANAVGWKILDNNDFQINLSEKIADSKFTITHLEVLRDSLAELVFESNRVDKKSVMDSPYGTFGLLKRSSLWTPETRKFILAGSQLLATLSFGWYGYHYLSDNTQDFDYSDFRETIKNKIRLGSNFRYDDNSWHTNEGHVYAGAVYYLQCRGAGFTALQSFMCSLAGSTAWEVLIEWREVYAINDQIFTIGGGAILSESIHQLGNYIDQKAPAWFQKSVGWLWKGPKKTQLFLNSKLLKGSDSDLDTNDPLVSGRFEFAVMTAQTGSNQSQKRIALKNEVNLIPFYNEPGREVKIITDLVESEFNLDAPTQEIVNQYNIFAKLVLAAYYTKDIKKDSHNQLNGYSLFIGPSSAIDLRNDKSLFNDFMGIVHVIGPSVKLVNYYKGFKITSSLDIWGDSVMMKSFMIEQYKDKNGAQDLVGNLAKSNYYHGWGYTTRGQVIVEYGDWKTGFMFNSMNSVNTNFRQRDLGRALKELDINDQTNSAEIFIERTINANLKVRFAVERFKRSGEIAGFGANTAYQTRKSFSVVYYF